MTQINTPIKLSDIVFSIMVPQPKKEILNNDLGFVIHKFTLKNISGILTPLRDLPYEFSAHATTTNIDFDIDNYFKNTFHISLTKSITYPKHIEEIIESTQSIELHDLIEFLNPRITDYSLDKTFLYHNISHFENELDINPIIDLTTLLIQSLIDIDIDTLTNIFTVTKKAKLPLQKLITSSILEKSNLLNVGNKISNEKKTNYEKNISEIKEQPDNTNGFIKKVFDSNGYLSKYISNYELRTEQIHMSENILNSLKKSQNLIVEAGTGTGKSLAYLIPAFLESIENDSVTVISTNTINLQEQLINDDIPLTIKCLESAGIKRESIPMFSLLKGKSNYICTRRLGNVLKSESFDVEDCFFLIKLLVWVTQTETGDRSELIFYNSRQKIIWDQVSEDSYGICKFSSNKCFFKKAKENAGNSKLIITNHSLLMADITSDGATIPSYNNLIIDEGHHLEDQATNSLGFKINHFLILELIEKTENSDSSVETSIKLLRPIVRSNELNILDSVLPKIKSTLIDMKTSITELFNFAIYESDITESVEANRQIRITEQIRSKNWNLFEEVSENIILQINTVTNQLTSITRMLESRTNQNIILNLYNDLSTLKSEYYVISENLSEFIFEPNKNSVYWVEKDIKNSKLELNMAPIEVAQILNENLFSNKDSVILTSATLSTNQSFDHIKGRLGLEVDNSKIYPSPFEYKESALMLMPENIPDPRDENYIDHVSDSIRMASLSAQGRTLALFTSHSSIRKVYEKLKPVLAKNKIEVLAQSISGNPQQLVNHLRKNPNTLLLGTSSMWEGIDIRGDSLQILIITRLPFGVPTDPIYQARSEKYKNPFMEFAIPTAILKFKQGFGRLIRSDTDRGIFIMLDNRVSTKRYGSVFIESLPTMDKQKYKGKEMIATIKTWLNQTNTR